MKRIVLLVAAVSLGATGCVSAAAPDPQPTSEVAGADLGDRRCAVFEAGQLRRLLGQPFQGPVNTAESGAGLAECLWTSDSQTALVIVKASDGNGPILFQAAQRAAARSIGQVVRLDVAGAKRSFGIPRLGRVGMVVSGDYVEVSTLVPGASDAQVTRLAELAAAARTDG